MMLPHDTRAGGSREVRGSAIFNGEKYRLELRREWAPEKGTVNFVMLNPSIATEFKDDPTIRRCIGFARAWGFGAIVVTNLFSFRSTNPHLLKKQEDPVGPGNDEHILEVARKSQKVILAWGAHGVLKCQDLQVIQLLQNDEIEIECLGYTAEGCPQHPLYVPATRTPMPYRSGQSRRPRNP